VRVTIAATIIVRNDRCLTVISYFAVTGQQRIGPSHLCECGRSL